MSEQIDELDGFRIDRLAEENFADAGKAFGRIGGEEAHAANPPRLAAEFLAVKRRSYRLRSGLGQSTSATLPPMLLRIESARTGKCVQPSTSVSGAASPLNKGAR